MLRRGKMDQYSKIVSTICYVKNKGKVLMLYRNKLDSHFNKRSYRGLGGKVEYGENPLTGVKREVKEEAGIDINPIWKGLVTFSTIGKKDWEAHVFVAEGFEGELTNSNEGDLEWVDESEMINLDMPEGDKKLIPLLFKDGKFHAHLKYGDNKNLLSAQIGMI